MVHKFSNKKPGTRVVDKRGGNGQWSWNMVGYEGRDHSSQEKVSHKLNSSYYPMCTCQYHIKHGKELI